ncbi:MAG TPA: PDZ domain-containing protein [Longimicrobiales bacterium]
MEGDVLVAVNGDPVTTEAAGRHLSQMVPGTPITLTLRRSGRMLSVVVAPILSCETLEVSAGTGSRPVEPGRASGTAEVGASAGMTRVASLGLMLVGEKELDVRSDGSITWWFVEVPVVARVDQGSPAANAAIVPGDVVLAVNEHPINTATGTAALLSAATEGGAFRLRRGTNIVTVQLRLR